MIGICFGKRCRYFGCSFRVPFQFKCRNIAICFFDHADFLLLKCSPKKTFHKAPPVVAGFLFPVLHPHISYNFSIIIEKLYEILMGCYIVFIIWYSELLFQRHYPKVVITAPNGQFARSKSNSYPFLYHFQIKSLENKLVFEVDSEIPESFFWNCLLLKKSCLTFVTERLNNTLIMKDNINCYSVF